MDPTQAPQSRTERSTLAVTPHEKHALRFLCGHRKTTESELLRVMLVGDVVREYDRLMGALEQLDGAAIPAGEAA